MKERVLNTSGAWRVADIIILGVVALIIRAAYLVSIVGLYGAPQESDFGYLHGLAESLAAGRGFTLEGDRIYNQSVGYPAFLAIFYSLFGPDLRVAMWINVLLGALSVILVYIFAGILLGGNKPARRVALTAAGVAAIYPENLLYVPFVAAENLLIPLMMGMLIAAVWPARHDWFAGVLTGILAAAAASVKAQVILGCVLIPFIWIVSRQRPLIRTIAAAAAAVVCLAPWTWMNYRDSGGYFVPFTAVAGEVFLDGTNPLANGKPTNILSLGADVEAGHNKIEIDRMKMRQAMDYIRERPAWYAKLLLLKLVFSLSPARDFLFEHMGQMRLFTPALSRWGPTLINALMLIGVAAGCFAVRNRPVLLAVAAPLVVGMFAMQLIFMAFPRYRYPFLFCLLPYAALGWLAILEAAQRRLFTLQKTRAIPIVR